MPPIQSTYDSDITVDQLKSLVEMGLVSTCSPVDGMYEDWSDADKKRLNASLAVMFGWKSKD
jgi:hypothetical protein